MALPQASPMPYAPTSWGERIAARLSDPTSDPGLWDMLEHMGARPWDELPLGRGLQGNLLGLVLNQSNAARAHRWAAALEEMDPTDRANTVLSTQQAFYQRHDGDQDTAEYTLVDLAAPQPDPWAWDLAVALTVQHAPEQAEARIWQALAEEMKRNYGAFPYPWGHADPQPMSALGRQGQAAIDRLVAIYGFSPDRLAPLLKSEDTSPHDWRAPRPLIPVRVPSGESQVSEPIPPPAPLPPRDGRWEEAAWRHAWQGWDHEAWHQPAVWSAALELDLQPTDLVPVNQASSSKKQPIGLYASTHAEAPPSWKRDLQARFPAGDAWLPLPLLQVWISNLLSDWGQRPSDHPQPPAALGAFFATHLTAQGPPLSETWWEQCVAPVLKTYAQSRANRTSSSLNRWGQGLAEVEYQRHTHIVVQWLALSFQHGWLELPKLSSDAWTQVVGTIAEVDHPSLAIGLAACWQEPGVISYLVEAGAFQVLASAPVSVQTLPQVQAALGQPQPRRSPEWEAARRHLQLQGQPTSPPRTRPRPRS